jgi:hypothetical protein
MRCPGRDLVPLGDPGRRSRGVQLEKWNEVFASWYFSGPAGARAYFRVDDAELRRINAALGLGLDDPSEQLLHDVRLSGLRYAEVSGQKWSTKATADAVPPWLPYLAITVLLVERQTEQGSTAFYDPLRAALGLPKRLSDVEYGDTFHRWWVELARWLTITNDCARGVPTWRRIPPSGPRSIIGHPYTQVLLRRDEREDIDDFLASLEGLMPGDLEIADEPEAARSLVHELRKWAATRRGVSARLRAVLEGGDSNLRESLGFVLLDRLLDLVQGGHAGVRERVVRIVPSLDDWMDRTLRLSAIGPADTTPDAPLVVTVDGTTVELLEAGQPGRLPIALTEQVLASGLKIEVNDRVTLMYSPRSVVPLAARAWAEWCGVTDADPGESLYLLVEDAHVATVAALLEQPSETSMDGVPDGWKLLGPSRLVQGADLSRFGVRSFAPSVPRFVGGLPIDHRQYLHGGEPDLAVPDGLGPIAVDGVTTELHPETIRLSTLGLSPGPHTVGAGPYRLPFFSISPESLPLQPSPVGRTSDGKLLGFVGDETLSSGGSLLPREHRFGPAVVCTPCAEFCVFGQPGEYAIIKPTRSMWAEQHGLEWHLFDPLERTTFPGGDRMVRYPWWVATHIEGSWAVVMMPTHGYINEDAWIEPEEWREAVSHIGRSPSVVDPANPGSERPDHLEAWHSYIDNDVAS